MSGAAVLAIPRDLASLVAHAYAASERLAAAYYDGTGEEDVSRLEELDFAARRAVRAKLAELGADPRMLAKVLA